MNAGDPLSGLHDIVLPEPVGWWPQTVGSWLAIVSLAVIATWLLLLWLRRRKRNRYRQRALAEIAALEERFRDGGSIVVCRSLPELVKRTALVAYPRTEVASLAGDRWLGFLDRSYGGAEFTDGPGRLLPDLAYAGALSTPPPSEQMEALFSLVRRWVRGHRPGFDDEGKGG